MRLRIRIHDILDIDRTPLLHTHPFHYVSVVLSGGYVEQVEIKGRLVEQMHLAGSVIVHTDSTFHRITHILPNTKTLFVTWYTNQTEQGWTVKRHPNVLGASSYYDAEDGLYQHASGFRKRKNGVWFCLRDTTEEALECRNISIHQDLQQTQLTRVG